MFRNKIDVLKFPSENYLKIYLWYSLYLFYFWNAIKTFNRLFYALPSVVKQTLSILAFEVIIRATRQLLLWYTCFV